jgi:RNA polymerase sigma-70 factor, ECF subfamily
MRPVSMSSNWTGRARGETSAAQPQRSPAQTELNAHANAAMTRYAQGEDDAFAELYQLLSPRLYRLCLYLCGANDAEELLQDTFLKIHRTRARFVETGGVVAWAFAIARMTHLDRVRYKRRRRGTTHDCELLERQAAPGADPDSMSAQHMLEVRFERELSQLTDNLRSAYVLVKLHGMSCLEASETLDVSVDAVKQRVHRACEKLKSSLTEALEAA